jgi:hypothetical protein
LSLLAAAFVSAQITLRCGLPASARVGAISGVGIFQIAYGFAKAYSGGPAAMPSFYLAPNLMASLEYGKK